MRRVAMSLTVSTLTLGWLLGCSQRADVVPVDDSPPTDAELLAMDPEPQLEELCIRLEQNPELANDPWELLAKIKKEQARKQRQ